MRHVWRTSGAALLFTAASSAAAASDPSISAAALNAPEDGPDAGAPDAVPENTQANTPENAAPVADLDDIWIVEMRLRRRVVLLKDVLAYGDGAGENMFVPVSQLASALEFPITFDAQSGLVSGWFLRENQRFEYSAITGEGSVAGRSVRLSPKRIVIEDDEIYLPLVVISQWLQLGAEWQSGNQLISLDPAYLLASEEAGRRANQAGFNRSDGVLLDAQALPRFEPPYRLISWPHARVNLTASTRGASGTEFQGNAVLRGDLAFMSGEVFASATSSGNSAARVTLSRSDPDSALFGPLRASDLRVGALSLSQAPLTRVSTIGTGLRLAREPSGDSGRTFSERIIEGPATPGWQAELYRGSQLLGFQTIGDEGRYVFEDVPLQVGENRFTVRLYGPQGEQEETERRFNIARSAMQPGEFTYLIEAIEPRRPLGLSQIVDPDDPEAGDDLSFGDDPIEPQPGEQGLSVQGQVAYGLTESVAMRGLLSWQEVKGAGNITFAGVGSDISAGGALFSVDTLVSQDGEWAGRGGVAFDLAGISVFAEHEQFSAGFRSNANSFSSDTILRGRSDIRLDGTVRLGESGAGLNWGAQYSRSRFGEGRRFEAASFRLSTAVRRVSLSNRIAWTKQFDEVSGSSERVLGTASAAGTIGPVRLRAGVDYSLLDDGGLRNFSLDAQTHLKGFALNLRYQRNQRARSNSVSFGFSRDLGGIRLGTNIRYDDFSGSIDGLITLSFALDRSPTSGRFRMGRGANSDRGLAIVSAFEDDNLNGLFDADERELEGFGIIAQPRGRVRDEGNQIVLSNFAVDRRQAIALDGDTLEDPFAIPSTQGVSVISRPGAVAHISLPVIQSGEIEYIVKDDEGDPLAGTIIELTACDTETRYRERSAYDGLVLFQRIPPGCYELEGINGKKEHFDLEPGETLLMN